VQEGRSFFIAARDCVGARKQDVRFSALIGQAAAHGAGSANLNCNFKVSPNDVFTRRIGDALKPNASFPM